MERTLSIIKPDGVRRQLQGKILAMIQDAELKIVAQKFVKLTMEQVQKFYEVHKDRPFYMELCESMIQTPVSIQVLEGENAVKRYRDLMGDTNPIAALDGTIRKVYGLSIGENTVHGSDSVENAVIEIEQLFDSSEIYA